uniref:Hexosyltransferase n=1 Tax=Ciona intestinalis TaxID=7719 RepID=Q9NDP5_CIOIN|nr:Not6 protein [Ciona intestinalis]BAB00632.1 Not6 [Ciona intestinalis]|eukprot:NP_001027609.1 Not6 protein [Ciona intestinalis]
MRFLRGLNILRIMTGIMLGFLSRIAFEQLRGSTRLTVGTHMDNIKSLDCPKCPIDDHCTLCEPTHVKNPTENIPSAYKPKGMYEVTRWLQFDEHYVYDIINEEPKIPLVGHWLEEVRAVTHVAMDYINANRMLGQSWSLVKLHDGYLRRDALRGTEYILDVVVQPASHNFSYFINERMFRVNLVHPLKSMGEAEEVRVQRHVEGRLKIIVPAKITSPGIVASIDNFVKSKPKPQVHLVLVLFLGSNKKEISGYKNKLQELETKIKSYQKVNIQIYPVEGLYSYFKGVRYGIKKATISTDVVLLATIEAAFTEQLYHHCQANAIPKKRVYFPIAFGQFNPDIIKKGMPPGKPKDVNKRDHNKFTGYWMHDTFDFVCANQADMVGILNNLSSLGRRMGSTTEALGTKIYDAFLRSDIEVICAVEPGLYRTYGMTCSKGELTDKSYQHCMRTKAMSLGSKPALGILYINEVLQKKN